jgi:hypothetical protein
LDVEIEVGSPSIVVFGRELPCVRTDYRVLAISYTLACLTWETSLLVTTCLEVGIVQDVVDSQVDRDRLTVL